MIITISVYSNVPEMGWWLQDITIDYYIGIWLLRGLKPASSSVWRLGTNSPVVEPMLFIVGLICKLYSWLKIPEAHVIFLMLILPSKPKVIKVSKIFLVCLLPNLRKMLWIPVVSFSVHTAMGLRQQQQMITTWCLHRTQFRVKTWYGPNQWTVCTCEYMIGCRGSKFWRVSTSLLFTISIYLQESVHCWYFQDIWYPLVIKQGLLENPPPTGFSQLLNLHV